MIASNSCEQLVLTTQANNLMKSGDFYLGSRTRDSANRRLALNHSATGASIRFDTCHRGGAGKNQDSVCGIPGSTPEMKSPDFIKILIRWTVTPSLVEVFHSASLLFASPLAAMGHHS